MGAVILGCVVALTLSGCNVDRAETSTPLEWEEPTWFGEARQYREELSLANQSCMVAKGWSGDNVVFDEVDSSASLQSTSEAEHARFREDFQNCGIENDELRADYLGYSYDADEDYFKTPQYMELLYSKNVDIWECLNHYDSAGTPPPEYELWEESYLAGGGYWIGYADARNKEKYPDSQYTFRELEQLCPQVY